MQNSDYIGSQPAPHRAPPVGRTCCTVCGGEIGVRGAVWVWPSYPRQAHERCVPWGERAFPFAWVVGLVERVARECGDEVHGQLLRRAAQELRVIIRRWEAEGGSLALLERSYAAMGWLAPVRGLHARLWQLPRGRGATQR